MPQKQTLTDQSVRNCSVPTKGTATYWDSSTRGFGLRVSAGGSKAFIVLIGSGRRQSLGHYPHLSLAVARAEAKRVLAEKTLGKIRPAHMAFDDAKAEYLKECETRIKPRTLRDYTRLLNRYYRFDRKSVAAITAHDLAANLKKLNRVSAERHHAYTAGRAFFRYCVRSHIIEQNPMERVAVLPPNNSRERVLTEPELAKVLKQAQAGSSTFDAIVSLLLLTGQRRSEIAALEWAWIDRTEATITLPPEITKNSREHTIPIGQMTLDVLERVLSNRNLRTCSRRRASGLRRLRFSTDGENRKRVSTVLSALRRGGSMIFAERCELFGRNTGSMTQWPSATSTTFLASRKACRASIITTSTFPNA